MTSRTYRLQITLERTSPKPNNALLIREIPSICIDLSIKFHPFPILNRMVSCPFFLGANKQKAFLSHHFPRGLWGPEVAASAVCLLPFSKWSSSIPRRLSTFPGGILWAKKGPLGCWLGYLYKGWQWHTTHFIWGFLFINPEIRIPSFI